MKSQLNAVLTAAFTGAVIRHVLVLHAIFRSHLFLRRPAPDGGKTMPWSIPPTIYVVIPVLREAVVIREAVDHFQALITGYRAELVIVTTTRERVEGRRHPAAGDTVTIVRELAEAGRCIHLHYPDPAGLKGDQLNFAAHCIESSLGTGSTHRAFLLFYDADSRPPLDSLAHFQEAFLQHSESSVFHQSSRFEIRPRRHGTERNFTRLVREALADAGALRANRFVAGYELPRLLNRSRRRSPWKRWVSSYVYTHVTGHGLCVRLSLLHDIPFPGQSPLEDMHYSFILGSRGIPMEPVHSLDRADVPLSLRLQVEQAARWFYGPGRFLEYLRDPQTARGPRAYVLALSALAICAEWLSCAVLPPSLLLLLWRAPTLLRATAGAFVLVYASQLVASDLLLGASCAHPARLARLVGYPVNCALFGVGGWIGASRLLRRDTNSGKTERCIG